MRKDPCAQINLRLDPELARKLKALSAISGRSLNALITLAVDEYLFLRRATVLQGQKIVDGYANFYATLKPVRSAEEREALQAAQSQEMKSAIQAERAAYAQAQTAAPEPTPLAGTGAQGAESVNTVEALASIHVEAAPSQTAEPVGTLDPAEDASQAEDAACMPWAREQAEAQDPTQNQEEAQEAAPLAGTSQKEDEEPAWVLAARKREAMRLELQKREKEEAAEWAAREEERKKQNAAAWAAKTAADTARICAKQDDAQAERMTLQAEEQERRLQREGAISCLYVVQKDAGASHAPAPEDMDMDQGEGQEAAPDSEEASQSMPANESEGEDASQEEPSHMAGNADASQTVEAVPVAQKAVKDMSIEEKRARARELKAQGLTYQQIADAMGTNKSTAYHWANK